MFIYNLVDCLVSNHLYVKYFVRGVFHFVSIFTHVLISSFTLVRLRFYVLLFLAKLK